MRTAKYHDYTVLKIVLFIVVLVAGLLIYTLFIQPPVQHQAADNAWLVLKEATCTTDGSRCKVCTECGEYFDHEVIPATGHTSGAAVKENQKPHSETKGESYESVKYCIECKAEVSRELVYPKHGDVTGIIQAEEKRVEPTCTTDGSYEAVRYCKDCNFEFSRENVTLSATGHSYDWELVYINETFIMTGVCQIDGSTTSYTEATGLKMWRDKEVASCCLVRWHGSVVYNKVTYEETMDFPADTPHLIYCDVEAKPDFSEVQMYLPEAKVDEFGRMYYDIDEVPCIIYYNHENNQWDDNGFALGMFKCYTCEQAHCENCPSGYTYIVRIYSKDMDKRLNKDTES